jgi:hypothetical protein
MTFFSLFRFAAATGLALVATSSFAATSAQLLTPQSVALAGGESRTFSVRLFDALGNPAAGELVHFANDVCGTFANGGYAQDVRADATGMASVNFRVTVTPGVTCWVIATAGITARFDVLTYPPSTVYFTLATNPAKPRPTEPYDLSVSAWMGQYKLYEVDIAARIIAGTASATLSAASDNTGQEGSADFHVTPDERFGDYQIEVSHLAKTQRFTMSAPANPWQDMWWSGEAENGWGMSLVQHADRFFSVIYAYDTAGKPTWYVMPAGAWDAAHTRYSGSLYSPRGAPYTAYDPSRFTPGAAVGTATFVMNGINDATLDYTIAGVTGTKRLSRQDFARADTTPGADYGDMWWGGAAQNGWGLSLLQQYRSLFAVWFTYDAAGAPTWLVMPAGFWSDASTWEGRMYRTTGSPWLGRAYDAAKLVATDVGSFRIRFGSDGASFDYLVDGRAGSATLAREPF